MSDAVYFIALYFIIVLLLGLYSYFRIATPSDYYIAGKKAGLLPVTSSLLATILGGSAILGTIELSQKTGWPALWFLFCASLGLFLLVPLAKYVSRYGKYTLPGLLGRFYGEKAQLIASVIIPVAWLGIIAAQIIAAAKILASLGIIEYSTSAILSGLIFIFYTLAGGQVSILKTDVIQSIFIISGLIIMTIFIFLSPAPDSLPELNTSSLFNEYFTGIDLIILILTYSVTFVVGPDIYSRIFCAKNEKTATKSVLIVALILVPVSFMLSYMGVYSGSSGGREILLFAGNLLPPWLYGVFLASLLSAVMSSADTTLMNSSLILSELIYKNSDDKISITITRIIIIISGTLSIIIALYVTSIMQALLISLTFFSGAFVIPMLAGLLNLKSNKDQVMTAIIAGGIIALTGKLINIFTDPLSGNIIIISSFVINGLFLFVPFRKPVKDLS
jgi:SSS family solute:Na+ symporter